MVVSISRADLLDAALDGLAFAGAFDDRRVVVVDADELGLAELVDLDLVQFDAQVLHDGLAAGEDGDVLEHGLAAVAVAGGLDRDDVENSAQLVDHQRRQGFALNVLGDDKQGPLGLLDFFQQGDELGGRGNLVLVNEDEGLFQFDGHFVGVGDEIGGKIAAVELHAFDHIDVGFQALAFLDGDDAVLADASMASAMILPTSRSLLAEMEATLAMSALPLIGLECFLQGFDDGIDGFADAAGQGHGVGSGGEIAIAFLEDRLGQYGRGGGSVTGDIAGLAGGLLHEFGADVLVFVREFDFLGDGHAVLGNGGTAPALVQDRVSAAAVPASL